MGFKVSQEAVDSALSRGVLRKRLTDDASGKFSGQATDLTTQLLNNLAAFGLNLCPSVSHQTFGVGRGQLTDFRSSTSGLVISITAIVLPMP